MWDLSGSYMGVTWGMRGMISIQFTENSRLLDLMVVSCCQRMLCKRLVTTYYSIKLMIFLAIAVSSFLPSKTLTRAILHV